MAEQNLRDNVMLIQQRIEFFLTKNYFIQYQISIFSHRILDTIIILNIKIH